MIERINERILNRFFK